MHSELPSSTESPPGEPGPTLRDPTPIITITPPQPQARSAYEFEIEYLQRCIRATHSRLQQKTSELDESHAQIEDDTRVIARQNEQIAALEDLVHKQKITISNQSKTISDPRLLRRVQVGVGTSSTSPLSVSTPSSASASASAGGVSLGVGLPLVHQGQQLPVGGGVFETNPPVSSVSSVFDVGGDGSARHDTVAGALGLSNVSSQVQQAQAQAQAQLLAGKSPSAWDPVAWSTGASPCASPYLNPGTCLTEIASRFRELWAKTELFGQIHANTPNAFKDSHLDIRVKDYVMSVSDKHGASSLLDSPATRFFLVAKAINFFLAREVLKTTMIRGFNDQVDAEILSLKEQITPGQSFLFPSVRILATTDNCRYGTPRPPSTGPLHRHADPAHSQQARLRGILPAQDTREHASTVAVDRTPHGHRNPQPGVDRPVVHHR